MMHGAYKVKVVIILLINVCFGQTMLRNTKHLIYVPHNIVKT
jgi:hypothetical protein